MSIDTIYQAFQAAATAGSLTGDAPPGLADLLTSLGVTTLAVTGGTTGRSTDSAWLRGTTTYLNTTWTLVLTGRDGADPGHPTRAALSLALTGTPSTGWPLSQGFPGTQLPASRRSVTTAGNGLQLADSVIAPLTLDQVQVQAANVVAGGFVLPHLKGWLNLAGTSLAGYTTYLGASRLWLDGTVDFKVPAAPVLVLDAPAPGASLSFGRIQLSEVGLRLRNDYPDPAPLPDQGAPTSAAMLYAKIAADTSVPVELDLSTPWLTGDYVWPIYASFGDHPLTLSSGAALLAAITGAPDADFSLPEGLAALNAFGVSEVEFGLLPAGDGGLPGVAYSAIAITSTTSWNPPIPFVVIDRVGVRWVIDWTMSPPFVETSIWGTMTFGSKTSPSVGPMPPAARNALPAGPDDNFTLTVRMDLPDQSFVAYNENPLTLTFGQALAAYFADTPADMPAGLTVTDFTLDGSLPRKTVNIGLGVDGNWPVACGTLTFNLSRMELQVKVSQSSVSGSLYGTIDVTVPGKPKPSQFFVEAAYPGDGHWEFSAGLVMGGEDDALDLPAFVAAFLGTTPPTWLSDGTFSINLTALSLGYSTATGNPYHASGTLVAALDDKLLGIPMSLTASASIARAAKGDGSGAMVTSGSVSGTFEVMRFKVTAGLSFEDDQKTYLFSVAYGDLALTGTTAVQDGHQVLTLRLTGATLGSVVEALINLANPNANYRLEAPWSFLNSIDLGRFALVIDPTLNVVTLKYDVNLELGFANLTSVGLGYQREDGKPTVRFVLTGKFLNSEYTDAKPLTWDPVNEAPPAVPGKGQNLFELRYFGMGQHVTPKGLTSYTSISAIIDAMRADMTEITDPNKNPIDPAKMVFDPASQWLFGIDATFMDTVTLKLVLHDPDLYGVLLSLAGPEAGSLAGLEFELLYKKVTPDVGVFHVRLQVPDAFRQLQFGAVAVTLGVITVDIYTNGNFEIDLGFPHGGDFSDSFGLEFGIFNGRGGIYFGLLDGSTSSRVPQITNGTFSPVLELGVGLQVGVGRTFDKGPLSAGLYVDVEVIFEGVLAWFHPTDPSAPTAMYYAARGTAGIVGKLYGSVDFKIISVSVSVEAHATATITLAAYQATLVELNVGVSVEATVHFLFFSIDFSFDMTISTSFSIGDSSPTPWAIAPTQGGTGSQGLRQGAFIAPRRRPVQTAMLTREAFLLRRSALLGAALDGYHLAFDKNAQVFPDQALRTGTIMLVPAFTVANVPVDWTNQGDVTVGDPPDYRIDFLLLADRVASNATTNPGTTFDQVVEGMLRWSLNAMGVTSPTATVTLGQLQELVSQLGLPEAAEQGFTFDNLSGFLGKNLHLTLSGPPATAPTTTNQVVFPMVPSLEWTAVGLPADEASRQFWLYRQVDTTYEGGVIQYFQLLDARQPADQPDAERRMQLVGDASESMATFIFRDYFAMVARAAAQASVDLLSSYPHTVLATDSLAGIADGFPETTVGYVKAAGDTAEQVAAFYGMSLLELLVLNPRFEATLDAAAVGATVNVTLGVTPESIAAANPAWKVTQNLALTLGTLPVVVNAGDTLGAIATRYGADADTWLQAASLTGQTGLLQPGATMGLGAFSYPNPNALPLDTVAAVFYVRLPLLDATLDVPNADWYVAAIQTLNATLTPLPATLTVPTGFQVDISQPANTTTWTVLPGDTVLMVADYLALMQNVVTGSVYDVWRHAVEDANPGWGGHAVLLPTGTAATILPDDTLDLLQSRLLLASDGTTFRSLAKAAPFLAPLATVQLPAVTGSTGTAGSLLALAQQYGLSLEELGARIADTPGVLQTDATKALRVPGVPALALADLVTALRTPSASGAIAGQIARFMLGGLRLPAPVEKDGVYTATGPMTGLYELIGQQVTGPAPGTGTTPAVTLTLDQGTGQAVDWLAFPASATSLVVTLNQDQLDYPATTLTPSFQGGLSALPLYRDMPVQHAMSHVIPWRTTVAPLLPGTPALDSALIGLWPLPGNLMAMAAGGTSASDYQAMQATPQAGPDVPPTELTAYAWAMLIDVGVKAIPGQPGTVEVMGADTADRQRLAALLAYLGVLPANGQTYPTPPAGEAATLTWLWQLPPSAGSEAGLTSTALTAAGSFIIKANLSTETHSGLRGLRSLDPTAGPYFASLAATDATQFLTLLWECSVVGGGGYWFRMQGDVPDSIFNQDGLATLSLLVQLHSQSTAPAPVRKLFAFNNVAVVGDGVEPSSTALFAQAVNPQELVRRSTVPPGQVGFQLALTNPGPTAPTTPLQALQQLYSLVGYQLQATTAFKGSQEGQPLAPQVQKDDTSTWNLMRVVPINRFAKASFSPDLPFHPAAGDSPYAGINGAGTPTSPVLAKTEVQLWFHDVLGNASQAGTSGVGTVDVNVGYTDALVGLSGWPASTTSYAVQGTGQLSVDLALQGTACQPAPGEAGITAATKAGRNRDVYAGIYYQVIEPDVGAQLLTTLRQAPNADPDVLKVSPAPLQQFATGAYVLLSSLATFNSYVPTAAQGTSINALATYFGVSTDAMGTANAATPLSGIFAGPTLAQPQMALIKAGQTVGAIAAAATPPVDPTTVLQDPDNTGLPLQAGTEIAIPKWTYTVPTPTTGPTAAPSAMLPDLKCSLAALVAANETTASLLTPGFIFECNGIQVQVATTQPQSEATLDGVASVFQQQGLPFDAAMVVSLNADQPGMFRAGAPLAVNTYVVKAGDTLDVNGSGQVATALAPLNAATVDLFPIGTPLFLQTVSATMPALTLGAYAVTLGCTPGEVLRHNGTATLAASLALVMPGLVGWPATPGDVRVPYTIQANDQLNDVAARFMPAAGTTAAAGLVALNAAQPGTLTAGASITVGGQTVQVVAGDGFQAFANRFTPAVTLDALAGAIGTTAGVLATGALLFCPPGLAGNPAGDAVVTPQDLATRFGVPAGSLLGLNAGMAGFLAPNVTISAGPGSTATLTTLAHDSLNAVIARFADQHVATTAGAIAEANATVAFLVKGTNLLVPPATATLQASLAVTPGTWRWPGTIFPIHVWADVTRSFTLCDPDLAGTLASPSEVALARTAVPAARPASTQSAANDGALTLSGFATQLETAMPGLRVATGKVFSEQETDSGTDVWAVVMATGGLASASITPPLTVAGAPGKQPRTFALRPLANTLFARQGVSIQDLDPKTGGLLPATDQNFQGVDLDVWARGFLADVELLLSAPYATGAYGSNRTALGQILDAKKALAGAIANGLSYVLQGEGTQGDTYTAQAATELRQSLLMSLSDGYQTSAVLQYDTAVTSPFATETARFSGSPTLSTSSSDPLLAAATLSNGKLSLKNGTGTTNFLLYLPDVGAHRTLSLAPTYDVVELEFDIQDAIDGYQESDWLTFVNPVGSGKPAALSFDLGQPVVPLPLRAYPPMPILLDHGATSADAPQTLAEAVLWTYGFRLQHQSSQQDHIDLTVDFNLPPPAPKLLAGTDALFAALAQYTAVSAPLMGLLADLQKAVPTNPAVLASAMTTYAGLAQAVASAWSTRWAPLQLLAAADPAPVGNGPVAETYGFSLDLQVDATSAYYTALRLERTSKPTAGQVGWPAITCITAAGDRVELTPAAAGTCGCVATDADCQCYTFPDGSKVVAFGLLTFEFAFGNLHVARYQNAKASARVTRNVALLGPTGPATVPDFVYQTPILSYPQPAVPFISVTNALPIGDWPQPAVPPAPSPLTPAFDTIFDGDATNRAIACGVRYGYELAPGLETYLPVKQSPTMAYDATHTIPDLVDALQTWKDANAPATTGGAWSFWIQLYSSLDPSLQRPLLQLKHVLSKLS